MGRPVQDGGDGGGGPWATGEGSNTRPQQAGPLWGQSKRCSGFCPLQGTYGNPWCGKKALGRPYLCLRFLSLPVISLLEEAEPGWQCQDRLIHFKHLVLPGDRFLNAVPLNAPSIPEVSSLLSTEIQISLVV